MRERTSHKWFAKKTECLKSTETAKQRLSVLVDRGLKYVRKVEVRRVWLVKPSSAGHISLRKVAENTLAIIYAETLRLRINRHKERGTSSRPRRY